MFTRVRNCLAMIVILSMLTLIISGCSQPVETTKSTTKPATGTTAVSATTTKKDSKFNDGGVFPICKEKTTLTICVNKSAAIADWKDNYQTKLLEEHGNFDLNIVLYPSEEYVTKLNLMVNAGGSDLQDIILATPGDTMAYSWAKAGVILPVTDYYKDPNASFFLTQGIKKSGVDLLAMITSPDDKIYGLPYFNQSYNNEYPAKAWIYKPYLTKLGLSVPKTTQDLYNLFNTIYNADVNGTGPKSTVCLTSASSGYNWIQYLMNSFIYAGDDDYLVVDNGKLSPAYNTDAWKEGLKYIKSMYDAGFIPKQTFTQDAAQFRTMQNNEKSPIALIIGYAVNDISSNLAIKNGYVGLLPMLDKKNNPTAVFDASVANIAFMITKNCKNVEAAFRLGDLLCSEELAITMRWGKEGVDWDYVKNAKVPYVDQYSAGGFKPLFLSYDDSTFWGTTNIQKTNWRMAGCQIRLYDVIWGEAAAKDKFTEFLKNRSEGQILYKGTGPKEYIPKLILNEDEIDKISETRKNLTTYINESMALFITGQKDIDKEWTGYLNELKTIGMDKFVSTAQTVFNRMYK